VLHGLRDATGGARIRTIAARALARLSGAQLLLVSDEVMQAELSRAREFALTADLLDGIPGDLRSDGLIVLRRFYRDAVSEAVAIVLQILGLTGQLPDVELIQASLRVASPKDRANAIETIEQSCPRWLFRLLQPLLVPRPATAGTLARATVETVLRRAGEGESLLESAAAFLGSHELQLADTRERLLARIERAPAGRFSATLATLLPLFESDRAATVPRPLHLIRRVAAMVRSDYFADASLAALEYLALRATEQQMAEGRLLFGPRQPSGDLIVVVEGAIELSQPSGTLQLVAGGTCNERTLMGAATCDQEARSQGCTVLAIASSVVMRAVEIFPGLGLSLYRSKIVPAPQP
jgi:hypothetical protein